MPVSVLVTDTPAAITAKRGAATLEQAFISYLKEAAGQSADDAAVRGRRFVCRHARRADAAAPRRSLFQPGARAFSYTLRETLELRRDPVRATLALLGTAS